MAEDVKAGLFVATLPFAVVLACVIVFFACFEIHWWWRHSIWAGVVDELIEGFPRVWTGIKVAFWCAVIWGGLFTLTWLLV